jgi:hypothetical protein
MGVGRDHVVLEVQQGRGVGFDGRPDMAGAAPEVD